MIFYAIGALLAGGVAYAVGRQHGGLPGAGADVRDDVVVAPSLPDSVGGGDSNGAHIVRPRMGGEKVFDDIVALLGEHFPDYVVIVRVSQGITWRSSDRTWGFGAARRYTECSDEKDRIDERVQADMPPEEESGRT